MIKNSLNFWLSFPIVFGTIINPANDQLSLNAATINKPQLLECNQPNSNLYSYKSYEGTQGISGNNGRNGESGNDGQDKIITIDGSSVYLDLSGTDGRDGDSGRDGYDARCRSIELKNRSDIRLANGGRGGNGGQGGNGGNGGSLTVIYSQLEHLKQVHVRSSGGQGGRGGNSARGGRGCVCSPHIFSFAKSDRKKIRCYHGQDGQYGQYGKDGRNGRDGTLYLVKQGEDFRPDQPTATISISSIDQDKPLDLSKNIWQSQSGANILLNPSSIIRDTYQEFVKRLDKEVIFAWKESQPITDFKDQELRLELTEKEQVLVSLPEEVWFDLTTEDTEQNTLLTINHAVAEEDTTRLTRGLISGDRSDLVFNVIDRAKKSNILATQFKIKYRTSRSRFSDDRGFGSYKTRFEGIIPASAVIRNGQRFSLALGQLPIDNKDLRPGTKVEIELTVIRSLGDNSAKQKVNWSGEIRNR